MTSTELRINNAVYCKYRQGHFLVKEITETWLRIADPKKGYLYSESYETVLPIDLSPDILEACGFEKKGGWMGKFYTTDIFDDHVEITFEVMDNCLVIYVNDNRARLITEPKLHQIMNAWVEFTGTELTINLEKVKV